ncbi:hypothetical protein ACJRO7_015679 [Eucalyptus globulus]|uniref:non-specific serine/threonine protein kinase n=1 Tax=Eucalyptus globulus TaxID=34317 RepID=A0ABD3L4H4_EUCGL
MEEFITQASHIGIQGLEDESHSNSPPIPEEVQIDDSPIYRIERQLCKGATGLVCAGRPIGPSTLSAVKFQQKHPSEADIPHEWKVYDDLGKNHSKPLPRVHYRGQQGDYDILVMDLLGPSLQVQLVNNRPFMPLASVACVAVEAISILKKLHSRGYIHGDVKPENFLLGPPGTPDDRKLFLIDLGLDICNHSSGLHIRYYQSPDHFRGTPHFVSVHAHLGRATYMLPFLFRGHLPWHGFQADNMPMLVCRRKMATPLEALCHSCPLPFLQSAEFAVNLRFDENPNCARYISLFRGIIDQNPYVWPVNADAARESNEGGVPTKSLLTRGGLMRLQWISIFHEHPPMRQSLGLKVTYPSQICYNGDNVNLPLFIEEAHADGMYVSSVASRFNLWPVVMDSGTSFTAQVQTISPEFLPQNWIRRQWARNYHITAIAGADNGNTLVVMSKVGTYITAVATVGSKGVVIMSSATGFIHQVVELDFQYPCEAIHERWKQGYFITSVAATPDQVAFIFSIPGEVPVRGPQQAAQASNFPETVVAESWPRNYYMSLLCFSRPAS